MSAAKSVQEKTEFKDVEDWCNTYGLKKYTATIVQEVTDLETLYMLERDDCMDLAKMAGMNLGDRRKLINAITNSRAFAKGTVEDFSNCKDNGQSQSRQAQIGTGLRRRSKAQVSRSVAAKSMNLANRTKHMAEPSESLAEKYDEAELEKLREAERRNTWKFQCYRSFLFVAIFLILHTATQHFILNPMFRPAPRPVDPQMLNRQFSGMGAQQGFGPNHGGFSQQMPRGTPYRPSN